MAQFPQGLGQVWQRCNAGQRRLLAQLKRCLGDEHLVWHDLPLAPGGQRPDFVLLSPRQGLLLLQLKDWTRSQLLDADRDELTLHAGPRPLTVVHPLHTAQVQARAVAQALHDDPLLVHADGPFRGQLLFPLGWGLVCSHLSAAELAGAGPGRGLADSFPAHRCLLRDDLADSLSPASFAMRLWGMLSMSYPCTLRPAQLDRIRWHLFPELRITAPAATGQDGTAQRPVLDLPQERILRSPLAGRHEVQGAAGTGKTQLLLCRALWLAEGATPARPVLLLCAHRALAEQLALQLRQRGADDRVQVRSLPTWCRELLARHQLPAPAATGKREKLPLLLASLSQAQAQGRLPGGAYHAVLLDDAQDMDPTALQLAAQQLDPTTRSLMLAHDDAPPPWPPEAAGRRSVLSVGHRHTAELQAWLSGCRADGRLRTVLSATPWRHGPRPVLWRAADARAEAERLADHLAQAQDAGLHLQHMAVLCATKALLAPIERALVARQLPVQSLAGRALRRIDWLAPGVRLLTIAAARGLEFEWVGVAGLQALGDDDGTLLHAAMSRSAGTLVLSAHGTSALADRLQAALADGLPATLPARDAANAASSALHAFSTSLP